MGTHDAGCAGPLTRLYHSRLTPSRVRHRVEPAEADCRIGSWWTLPRTYTREEIDRVAHAAERYALAR